MLAADTKLQSESFPKRTADSQRVQKDPKHRNSNDPHKRSNISKEPQTDVDRTAQLSFQ